MPPKIQAIYGAFMDAAAPDAYKMNKQQCFQPNNDLRIE